jgi:hypothetical protein
VVSSYLAKARSEIAKLERIERSFVVQNLLTLIEKCSKDDDRHHLLKALEQYSKIGGLYVEKPSVNVTTQGPVKIDFGGFDPDKPDFQLDNIQDVEHEEIDGSGVEDGLNEENNEDL